jgi:plasmid maintenance system antidote protein VapI
MIASYDYISGLLDRFGISLNSLAELAGVSTALLNRIANGSRTLTPRTHRRLQAVRRHLLALRREIDALS